LPAQNPPAQLQVAGQPARRGAAGPALTFPATLPRLRLDGLFVSPDVEVERYEVVETEPARRASDHLPVLAEVRLPSE
jgi:endonuclease/exonuclease/phosphatase family metal-dependent hydrolase